MELHRSELIRWEDEETEEDEEGEMMVVDRSGCLLLETPADLQNLLLLRKTRDQKAEVRKPNAAPPAGQRVPYYVDEDDFFQACDQNQLLLIDRYLSTGVDVSACDTFQRTGLHRASSQGHAEVITKLLEAGTDTHLRQVLMLSSVQLSSTYVHSACRRGNLSVVKLLLNHGADITATDKLDSIPLHVAVRTGHLDCVEHLIHCGAELNTQDTVSLNMRVDTSGCL
ncbi:LOW QUALITY PROTEIN: ankyrin repeat domain-containing protein 1-like [Brachyistius frenatus]|uniref:LOW QUALITY PROTEIN: ankyrin repeat domain-containing protein 1-like n=1 Tax=Brachyistius frenatus TaxID=100188 RepID=UPI0037E8004D